MRDLDRVRPLKPYFFGITGTINLNLEAKFAGNLFRQADISEKTWR